MIDFNKKVRLIFIPFLIISAGSIIVYCFLRWLLFIENTVISVDEDILNFWAPWGFVWIPILIWLRPRLKLLDLTTKSNRGDPLFGGMICASIAIAAPTVVAQVYLQSETGRLTKLDRIGQIDSVPQTKYYSVKNYYADKKLARFKSRIKITGRYNSDYDMYIYAVVPVYDSNHTTKTYNYKIEAKGNPITSDRALIVLNGKIVPKEVLYTTNPRSIKKITVLKANSAFHIYGNRAQDGVILIETKPYSGSDTMQVIHDDNLKYTVFAWLGIEYEKTVSNHLSSAEKDERFKQFAKASEADFKSKPLYKFTYLDRIAYSAEQRGYLSAVNAENYTPVAVPKNILVPYYQSFDERTGNSFPWVFGAFGIGAAFFMFLLMLKPLKNSTA